MNKKLKELISVPSTGRNRRRRIVQLGEEIEEELQGG